MKKIVCFGLCFLIVLCSFALCFADSYYCALLPKSSPLYESVQSSPYYATIGSNVYRYSASDSDVYLAFLTNTSDNKKQWVAMSKEPNRSIYQSVSGSSTISSLALSNYINGYYVNSGFLLFSDTNVPSYSDISVSDFVTQFFRDNSVSLDLTPILVGSVSWLSAVVDGVVAAPLLLFLILFSFVGIAVGLLLRFKRG